MLRSIKRFYTLLLYPEKRVEHFNGFKILVDKTFSDKCERLAKKLAADFPEIYSAYESYLPFQVLKEILMILATPSAFSKLIQNKQEAKKFKNAYYPTITRFSNKLLYKAL